MRGLIGAAGFVCVLLALAVPAHAAVEKAGGYSYVSEKGEVKGPSKKATVIKVTCPGKTHVISGGMVSKNAGYADMSSGGIPFDGKDDNRIPDDGWKSEALSYTGQKLKLEGRAVCGTELPFYVSSSTTVASDDQLQVSQTCPSATGAVGGGISGLVVTNASFPSGGSWTMYADNYSDNPQKVRSSAVCMGGTTSVSNSGGSVPAGSQSVGFLGCSSGQFGVGGGESNPVDFGQVGLRTFAASPGGFGYAIDSYDQGSTYTAYVVCRGPIA